MPTILFDKEAFKMQRFGGVSRYASELISGLRNSRGFQVLPQHYISNNCHLNSNRLGQYNWLYDLKKFRGKLRLIQYLNEKQDERIKKLLTEGKFDIFHPTYYQVDFLDYFAENKPFVLTVHDMIHEKYFDPYFNKIHRETSLKSILIPRAAHIIAVSGHTKKDILSLYPEINPGKITVIHHGYSRRPYKTKTKIADQSGYLLFVGTREHYKNFEWMLETIASFMKTHKMLLICAGGGAFSTSEIDLINNYGLNSQVLLHDNPNDNSLNDLYQNAFCFIFPSLYEGFGLPILEAFANDCPVILAKATCFPEIGGKAALYFQPGDPVSLMNQLEALLKEDSRDELIKAGRFRLQDFSWSETVEQHKRVYEMVMENSA